MANDTESRVVEYLSDHGPAKWIEIYKELDVTEDELEAAIDDLLEDHRLTFGGGGYGLRD